MVLTCILSAQLQSGNIKETLAYTLRCRLSKQRQKTVILQLNAFIYAFIHSFIHKMRCYA